MDPSAEPRDFSRPDEFARRALNTVKAQAKKNGYRPRSTPYTSRFAPGRRLDDAPGYSGPRPDARDPQLVGDALDKILTELGWDDGMSAGQVLAQWDEIVGPHIAEHSEVVSFTDGVLTVSATSSAWAAQLRMLSAQIVTRIHEEVGRNVVTELKVTGPATANWTKGKRTVKWRGPRDTYG